jgi:hypothetical protein
LICQPYIIQIIRYSKQLFHIGTAATVFQKPKPNRDTKAIYFKIALKDLDENKEIKGLH